MLKRISILLSISLVSTLLIVAGCTKTGGQSQGGTVFSEKGGQNIAEEYLRSSPTFTFDGMENTLKLVSTTVQQKPYCWEFNYEFKCSHAGYGDRSGQVLAQVITSHGAQIVVQEGKVVYAVLDDKWDMMSQNMINE